MKEYSISDILMNENIDRAVEYFGIEGTEEVIRRVYNRMPELRDKYLKFFYKKYNFFPKNN